MYIRIRRTKTATLNKIAITQSSSVYDKHAYTQQAFDFIVGNTARIIQ